MADQKTSPLAPVVGLIFRYVKWRRKQFGPRRPSWTPEFETFATIMRTVTPLSVSMPMSLQRKLPEMLGEGPRGQLRGGVTRRDVRIGQLDGAFFEPPNANPGRIFYYLHGGGYSIGSVNTHQDLLRRIALASGCTVFALNYRLTPDVRFPEPIDDAELGWQYVRDQGYQPEQIVLGGESAGGGLSLALLQRRRDQGRAMPAACVLISPWVDLSTSGESYQRNRDSDYLGKFVVTTYAKRYASPAQWHHPLVSPLFGHLEGLPPTLIHTGGAEVFCDENRELAARAKAAGVEVTFREWTDMVHAWHAFASFVTEGDAAIKEVGEFAKAQWEKLESATSRQAKGASVEPSVGLALKPVQACARRPSMDQHPRDARFDFRVHMVVVSTIVVGR